MSEYPFFQNIEVENLLLDDLNPRLPKSLQGQPEGKIIEFMLLEAATLELMQAIGENDFFIGEQLLVVADSDGKFCVVEGNRRLTAVKLLREPQKATVQKIKVNKIHEEADFCPIRIPCLVFKNKEDILKYLGFRHITGIKSWKLLEKARYLYSLNEREFPDSTIRQSARDLAKMIGSRKDYVERLLVGYNLYLIIEDRGFYRMKLSNESFFVRKWL